jgi:hypothetical protein
MSIIGSTDDVMHVKLKGGACGGPNSSSPMARPGLENAIAAVWSGVPVQRCTVGVVEEVSYSSLDAAISPSQSRHSSAFWHP